MQPPRNRSTLIFFINSDDTWHADVSRDEREFLAFTLHNQTEKMENWLACHKDAGFPAHRWFAAVDETGPDTIIQLAASFAIADGSTNALDCIAASGLFDPDRAFPDQRESFLHAAVKNAPEDIKYYIVKKLLELGADPEKTDKDGRTADQLADERGLGLIGSKILAAADAKKKAREMAHREAHARRLKSLDARAKPRISR